MNMYHLTWIDLSMAAFLLLALAWTSFLLHFGTAKSLLISAARATIQLLLIGLILTTLFQNVALHWVAVMGAVMLAVAIREVRARQQYFIPGYKNLAISGFSMFISAFTLACFALLVIIQNEPWYAPRYALPLLGMLLGNTMSGVALCLDRLNQSVYDKRDIIEQRLSLGEDHWHATREIRRDCARAGLMPIINAMTTAGLVNLPGMMTGQILGGVPPQEAVKYQILILLLIATSTVIGVIIALLAGTQLLFDQRMRLRVDRLQKS